MNKTQFLVIHRGALFYDSKELSLFQIFCFFKTKDILFTVVKVRSLTKQIFCLFKTKDLYPAVVEVGSLTTQSFDFEQLLPPVAIFCENEVQTEHTEHTTLNTGDILHRGLLQMGWGVSKAPAKAQNLGESKTQEKETTKSGPRS